MKNKEQGVLIAGLYSRLSDDDENDGTSVSIATQEKILREYCLNHNIKIYDFYSDDGYTGTNFDRPDFKRMMNDAKDGVINMIIVKDLSRFGRNYLLVGSYLSNIFPEMGIRFIAIGDDVDTETGDIDYDLMLPIKNVFNEYYPADCSRKTKQAFVAKAKAGEYIGSNAPYGYKKSQADKHILEVNEETSKNVVWMFEMAANQGYGYNKISLVLKEHKILTPSAYQAQQFNRPYEKDPYEWNIASVYKILNDKAYLGLLISGRRRKASFKSKRIVKQSEDKWIVVPDVVPPLVDQQLWNDAHFKLDSRKRTSKSGNENIFAGLIKCDKCGYALGIANASSRNNYFVCNTYKKKGPDRCSSHYILYSELCDAVLKDVNDVLQRVHESKEEFTKKVLQRINDDDHSAEAHLENAIRHLEVRISELDRKFDQLYDDKFSGVLSERKFRELSAKCESEQDEARAALEDLMKKQSVSRASKNGMEQFVATAEKYGELKTLDRSILNQLIDSIVIGDRVRTPDGNEQVVTINYRFIGKIA